MLNLSINRLPTALLFCLYLTQIHPSFCGHFRELRQADPWEAEFRKDFGFFARKRRSLLLRKDWQDMYLSKKAKVNSKYLLKRRELPGHKPYDRYLVGSRLIGAKLCGVDLTDTDFSKAILKRAYLTYANLSDSKFNATTLKRAKLYAANFSKSKFLFANLRRISAKMADFDQAQLSCADLTNADLSEASFISAILYDAILENAQLKNANLKKANLSDADLTGANLAGANLSEADLTGAYYRDENGQRQFFTLDHLKSAGAIWQKEPPTVNYSKYSHAPATGISAPVI